MPEADLLSRADAGPLAKAERIASTSRLKLSELIGALSHALDITEGQPKGHCIRCCWIGMHVGRHLGLDDRQMWELYYTLLLKDLGCSSNAARICDLYLTDDLNFKRDFKLVGDSLPQMLRFVFKHTGLHAGLSDSLGAILNIMRNGPQVAQELIQTRCQRGADIARQLRFPEAVAAGIASLDEHWNGQGKPAKLSGEAIPLYARIALLAQVVDVMLTAGGPQAAMQEVADRAGTWFDPELTRAFASIATRQTFWRVLQSEEVEPAVLALEPGNVHVPLDDDYLDDIAEAFGQVVDAKSPYTSGHSARVADYVDRIAHELGLDARRRRWLRRGALLHDVGKLGVSNAVLDKPGSLDATEWEQVRAHARHTEEILGRISAFGELASVAGAHHERLDGTGYPRGLQSADISLETRIITTADIFDALSAARPYRAALPLAQTMDMIGKLVGPAIDLRCFEALREVVGRDC